MVRVHANVTLGMRGLTLPETEEVDQLVPAGELRQIVTRAVGGTGGNGGDGGRGGDGAMVRGWAARLLVSRRSAGVASSNA